MTENLAFGLVALISFVAGATWGRFSERVTIAEVLRRYGTEMWPTVLKHRFGICHDSSE